MHFNDTIARQARHRKLLPSQWYGLGGPKRERARSRPLHPVCPTPKGDVAKRLIFVTHVLNDLSGNIAGSDGVDTNVLLDQFQHQPGVICPFSFQNPELASKHRVLPRNRDTNPKAFAQGASDGLHPCPSKVSK